MAEALRAAVAAGNAGEVPVGAVVVRDGQCLAVAGNESVRTSDPTAHAEVVALRRAGAAARNYRLTGSTLYATVEPCPMCMGAALHARVERIVFACEDPKGGAAVSLYRLGADGRLNHRIAVEGGLRGEEARALLQDFFRARRTARGGRE